MAATHPSWGLEDIDSSTYVQELLNAISPRKFEKTQLGDVTDDAARLAWALVILAQ
jgi:hypothetical protein